MHAASATDGGVDCRDLGSIDAKNKACKRQTGARERRLAREA